MIRPAIRALAWVVASMIPGVAFAQELGGPRPDPVPISAQAREQFRTGVTFLADPNGPRYEEAYRAFEAAYRDSPSPKILGNLGLCAMMLERDGVAITAYGTYLAEVADIEPAEREHIEGELAVLKASAVRVEIHLEPRDASIVDERTPVRGPTVVNRYGPELGGVLVLHLRAGQHRITVQREGYTPSTWTFEASPTQPLKHSIALAPQVVSAEPPVPPVQAAPPEETFSVWTEPPIIAGLVITGVLGAAAIGSSVLAATTHAAYEDARTAGDVARGDELRDRGETANIVADVLLVATGVGLLTTGAMLLFWPSDEGGSVSAGIAPTGATLRAAW